MLFAARRLQAGLQRGAQGEAVDDRRILRLLHELADGQILVHLHEPERLDLRDREGNRRHRHLRAGRAMLVDDLAEIHPVELVAREDEHVVMRESAKMDQIAPHGVGRPLIPIQALLRLLGREDVDKAAAEGVEGVGRLDVPVQGGGVELRQEENPVDLRIEAVADRNIHQPVFSGEGHGRLAALQRERRQAGAPTPAHDDRQNAFLGTHDEYLAQPLPPPIFRQSKSQEYVRHRRLRGLLIMDAGQAGTDVFGIYAQWLAYQEKTRGPRDGDRVRTVRGPRPGRGVPARAEEPPQVHDLGREAGRDRLGQLHQVRRRGELRERELPRRRDRRLRLQVRLRAHLGQGEAVRRARRRPDAADRRRPAGRDRRARRAAGAQAGHLRRRRTCRRRAASSSTARSSPPSRSARTRRSSRSSCPRSAPRRRPCASLSTSSLWKT